MSILNALCSTNRFQNSDFSYLKRLISIPFPFQLLIKILKQIFVLEVLVPCTVGVAIISQGYIIFRLFWKYAEIGYFG